MTLNEKVNYKNSNRVCKRVKYIYWVKKDLFGCFRIKEIREKDNEIGLKEGGGIEMSTTVLHSRAAPSFCIYLP